MEPSEVAPNDIANPQASQYGLRSQGHVPAVTFLMAVMNGAETLHDAIDSVLAQTINDFELVIVDDASTDSTPSILERYAADPRVRIITNATNMGSGASRNKAIDIARGTYLAVADADDIQFSNRLEVQLGLLDAESNLVVVGGQISHWGSWGGPVKSYWPTESDQIQRMLVRGRMSIAHCAAIMRTDAVREVGGYDATCRRAQDFALMRKLRYQPMAAVPEVVTKYRTVRPLPLKYVIANGRYSELARKRTARLPTARTTPRTFPRSLLIDLRSLITWARRRFDERRFLARVR